MRTEKEMFDLIINTANEDNRIKAVYMNGSRTNPNAKKDIFQDYDIVYVVDETKSFIEDKNWINRFGNILFMQYPDESVYYPSEKNISYGYLMQFDDGNRMDLHVNTLDKAIEEINEDELCVILLDKNNILPKIPHSSDKTHWVNKPTEEEFKCTCNEFWWCLNNVAKGLWRDEIPYVQDMLNCVIRPQLVILLSWKIGIKTDFSCSIGKSGKYMYKWLSTDEWDNFLKTYSDYDVNNIWNAVKIMCNLFYDTEKFVSKELSYNYNKTEAENCMKYLEHVRNLPKDAEAIY